MHAHHVAAVAVLVIQDGRVLSLRRSKDKDAAPGVWEALSGRLEPGEDPWRAAVREAHEETGLTVAVERRPWTAYAADRAGEPMQVVVYRGVPTGGELTLSDEHDAARWVDADEFAALSPLTALADAVRSALTAPPPDANDGAALEPSVSPDPATLSLTRDAMRSMGYRVIDHLVDHWAGLANAPASIPSPSRLTLEDRLRSPFPEGPTPFEEVLRRIDEDVLAEGLRVDHPRFFAYVPGPSNYVSVLAELLATGRNIFGGTWQASAGAVEAELVTVDWVRELLGMPAGTGGGFVSGGSMANLTALAAARHAQGAGPDAPVYLSDQTHASVAKGLRVLGFQPDAIRELPSDDAFRLDPDALRAAISEDRARGRTPFCVVANAGTTSTGAVDPLPELADLCAQEGMWLHIDGAYGAAAAITPEGAAALQGVGRADSVSLDPHKWLFQPFETGLVLVRDRDALKRAFSGTGVYMRDAERAPSEKLPELNPFEHGIQLTRSARALKVWASLQTFGVAAFRDAVARGFELARVAEADLRRRAAFEVVTPASMGIVTFRHLPNGVAADAHGHAGEAADAVLDAHQRTLVRRLAEDGFAMLSTTELHGRVVLRLCTINPRTSDEDVHATLDRLERLATEGAPPA